MDMTEKVMKLLGDADKVNLETANIVRRSDGSVAVVDMNSGQERLRFLPENPRYITYRSGVWEAEVDDALDELEALAVVAELAEEEASASPEATFPSGPAPAGAEPGDTSIWLDAADDQVTELASPSEEDTGEVVVVTNEDGSLVSDPEFGAPDDVGVIASDEAERAGWDQWQFGGGAVPHDDE